VDQQIPLASGTIKTRQILSEAGTKQKVLSVVAHHRRVQAKPAAHRLHRAPPVAHRHQAKLRPALPLDPARLMPE
jgi:hypothetical protein